MHALERTRRDDRSSDGRSGQHVALRRCEREGGARKGAEPLQLFRRYQRENASIAVIDLALDRGLELLRQGRVVRVPNVEGARAAQWSRENLLCNRDGSTFAQLCEPRCEQEPIDVDVRMDAYESMIAHNDEDGSLLDPRIAGRTP